MKNTTRHKIGLNPARGFGGAHSAPPNPLAGFKPILCLVVFFIDLNCMRYIGVRGGAPEALALFMFLEGKIQHFISIPALNLLKLTSRKRDIHERKYLKWGMMTLTRHYTI